VEEARVAVPAVSVVVLRLAVVKSANDGGGGGSEKVAFRSCAKGWHSRKRRSGGKNGSLWM
jgi:hypothetical protein